MYNIIMILMLNLKDLTSMYVYQLFIFIKIYDLFKLGAERERAVGRTVFNADYEHNYMWCNVISLI